MRLLERESDLKVLESALRDAAGGSGRIALVVGEAGIGKTALVEHFAQAQSTAVRRLWGACDPLTTPRPLGPLHDMAPELRGQLPALLNAETKRQALFSTLLVELQSRHTLAVFEDIHWADEATLDLLSFLSRRITRTSALVALTCREDELAPTHPVRRLLTDLEANPAVARIALGPISSEAVRRLLPVSLGLNADELYHRTGGNPFFVTEAVTSGAILSATVRDAVLARSARLSSAALRVVEAAAVLGARCEAWALAAVVGPVDAAWAECVSAGLLLSGEPLWTFRHELARQAILESIAPSRLMLLHGRALDVLRFHPETRNDLARLAHHADGANSAADLLLFAPAAARQASAVGAHRAAAELFRRAIDVADDLPVTERAYLWEAYARERGHLEPRTEAIAAYEQVAALWRAADNPQRLGDALAYVAMGHYEVGHKAECGEALAAALAVLETLPPCPMLMATYRTQALLCLGNAEDDRAIAWAERALGVAERLEDASVIGSALEGLGLSWLGRDIGRACAYLERSLALQREAQVSFRYATVCANLGSVYCEQLQLANAERVLSEGMASATEHDFDRLLAFMEGWRAMVWMYQGRWTEAVDLATSSLKRAASGQVPAFVTLGRIQARRGAASAGETLHEALTIGLRLGNLQRLSLPRAACAEGAWSVGDLDAVREHARALYDVAIAKRQAWSVGELAYWRWRVGDDVLPLPEWTAEPYALHIHGDWRGAAEAWDRLGCPYEQARALADGDVAAQTLALAAFDRLGALRDSARLRETLRAAGVRRIPRGPRPAARAHPFGLTVRQAAVLALIAEGLTNTQIAIQLNLSPKTVGNTVTALLRKLNVRTRHEAVEKAHRPPLA